MNIEELFNHTQAAAEHDYTPVPSGTYTAEAIQGNRTTTTKGTPTYKVVWQIKGGEHDGRRLYQDFFLTAKALPISKRDLAKLGITKAEQLEQTVPDGVICKIQVVQKQRDNGNKYNEVRSIEYLRTESNPFAPDTLQKTPHTPEGASSDDVAFADPQTEAFFQELAAMENPKGGE